MLALLALTGCGGSGDEEVGGPGPPVLEVSPPYEEWRTDSVPVARLGTVDGSSALEFSRIVFAGRLSDGTLVVVDGGSNELRWFGSGGELRYRAGGGGEGPAEFQRIVAAAITPLDSVVLYDARNRRLTWVGPDGAFARTRPAELRGRVTLVPLPEAGLLISDERVVPTLGGKEYNYTRDSVLVAIVQAQSERLDSIMHRPGREAATWVRYADGVPVATQQIDLPFVRPTLVGALGSAVAIVESDHLDVALFSQDGELLRRIRRTDVISPPVSSALRRAYVRSAVEIAMGRGVPEGIAESAAEALLAIGPGGRRVPPFDRILTDVVSHRIWIRDYPHPWEPEEPQRWTLHESDGRAVAQVTTPPELDVTHVGPGHVVGVEKDDLGVEYVVVYSFR